MKPVPILLCASLALLPAAEQRLGVSSEKQTYEITGKLLDSDQKPLRGEAPVMFLQGTTSPYSAQSAVDRSGNFKFKELLPGMYVLIAAVPRAGEMRKSVDVGPGTADGRRRIAVTLIWDR
ncbi:MAG: carboxypeptidase regulatory-like domain-containing protein, partial [Acidobacteria bacterium]|nr:carboxypeptidase regulatory-like domain-containing protein [Acidobacteriota bacterium]